METKLTAAIIVFAVISTSMAGYAAGPKYRHAPNTLNDEIENIYQDISDAKKYSIGTRSNDNACEGCVGEYIESVISTSQNAPTSNQYGDLTSIILSPGDWDVSITGWFERNGGTWSDAVAGISTTSGNSSAGLVDGSNRTLDSWASSGVTPSAVSFAIPSYRMSLGSTTTVYFKYLAAYTVGTPKAAGRISARRVR